MGNVPGYLDDIFMMTSSNGSIFRVTGSLCGEFTGPGEFPTQRPVTRSFDVYFDLRLNKRLCKQSWGWWFETLLCPLWRHSNVNFWYHLRWRKFAATSKRPFWKFQKLFGQVCDRSFHGSYARNAHSLFYLPIPNIIHSFALNRGHTHPHFQFLIS